jgi:hypothetical protein
MAGTLIACKGCQRHILDDEAHCPFCEHRNQQWPPRPRAVVAGRAAFLLLNAAALAGCGDDLGNVRALYGAPDPQSSSSSSTGSTGGGMGGSGGDGGVAGNVGGAGGSGGDVGGAGGN